MLIELVYDPDCPNIDAARQQIRLACSSLGLPAEWTEWERGSDDSPARIAHFGSPTVLVDGADVSVAPAMPLPCCRLYDLGVEGYAVAPSAAQIADAIKLQAGGEGR